MKALVLQKTGQASIETVTEPVAGHAQPEDFHAVIRLLVWKFPVDQAVSLVVPLFHEAADVLCSWSENPSWFKNIMVCLD